MAKAIASFAMLIVLLGCAKPAPVISILPTPKPYTPTQVTAINTERPQVAACCPNTDKAMIDYGKLRDKIFAAEQIQRGVSGGFRPALK